MLYTIKNCLIYFSSVVGIHRYIPNMSNKTNNTNKFEYTKHSHIPRMSRQIKEYWKEANMQNE